MISNWIVIQLKCNAIIVLFFLPIPVLNDINSFSQLDLTFDSFSSIFKCLLMIDSFLDDKKKFFLEMFTTQIISIVCEQRYPKIQNFNF